MNTRLNSVGTGLLLFIVLVISACSGNSGTHSKKRVVATTGMVADAAENLLGDRVEVQVLMGPGVDPHLYKASQGDMNILANADIILYSGHHLEGKMNDVLQKMSRTKPVLGIGEFIPENRLQRAGDGSPTIDPHLWMDSNIWLMGIAGIADTLQQLFPNDTAFIGNNYRNYRDTLEKVGIEVEQFITSIPSDRRVLITSHDAFRYFGLATQMEVKGLQGISTVSEYGLQDVSNMVNFITERKIKAVFVESSVSQKSLQAVLEGCAAKGHPIRIGGTLFSDSMGKKGTPEGSYKGMLRHNAQTIAKALR